MRFFLVGCLLCHRQNTAKYTKQTTILPALFCCCVPPNLFTMTLVNRSCASSANLMSKPFLIYCEFFFRQTQSQPRWCKHNWWHAKHGLQSLLYTRHVIVLYTERAKSFLSTSIYKTVNTHIARLLYTYRQSHA